VDGCFLGGADQVTVVDGHGGGNNFIPGALDPRAVQLECREFAERLPVGYDGLMCVGAHAMAGTQNAFIDHTQTYVEWFEYCINGIPCGEMAQQAYYLGAAGTPLVMMSGDMAACREAKTLVPEIAAACVKEAVERNRAFAIPQEEAIKRIRLAAAEGVRLCGQIHPCVLPMPAELKLTFSRNDYCDMYMHPGLQRDGRTVWRSIQRIESYLDLIRL